MTMTEFERQQQEDFIARSQPDIAGDPIAQQVIREAALDLRREQERRYIRDEELYRTIGLPDLDAVERHLSELVQSGFPFTLDGSSFVQKILVREHGTVRPSLIAERHEIERWLTALDAVVRRLGYVRQAETSPSTRSRVARVAAGAGAMLVTLAQGF
jgi:hypothetical protein